MRIFLVSFDDDEARFLVKADSNLDAKLRFAADREAAGCGKLKRSLISAEEVMFPSSGVREIGR